jgi:hypothetical protein
MPSISRPYPRTQESRLDNQIVCRHQKQQTSSPIQPKIMKSYQGERPKIAIKTFYNKTNNNQSKIVLALINLHKATKIKSN